MSQIYKKASYIAFDEVMTESPQQHEPIQDMTSSTNLDFVLISEPVPERALYQIEIQGLHLDFGRVCKRL